MNETKTGESPMNTKKIWTAPSLKVISLNSAKAGALTGNDGGGPRTKS